MLYEIISYKNVFDDYKITFYWICVNVFYIICDKCCIFIIIFMHFSIGQFFEQLFLSLL